MRNGRALKKSNVAMVLIKTYIDPTPYMNIPPFRTTGFFKECNDGMWKHFDENGNETGSRFDIEAIEELIEQGYLEKTVI